MTERYFSRQHTHRPGRRARRRFGAVVPTPPPRVRRPGSSASGLRPGSADPVPQPREPQRPDRTTLPVIAPSVPDTVTACRTPSGP
ncbi:hypothetical protein, partial [Streptomyces sp. NPDC059656]|uniref:hypothetical protein n=1 Tax=Streptomyces sp. NPDC059656 TaxID=3346898 RepID=UPI0036A9B943